MNTFLQKIYFTIAFSLICIGAYSTHNHFIPKFSYMPKDTIKEDPNRVELLEQQRINLSGNSKKLKADKLFDSFGYMASTDLYSKLTKENGDNVSIEIQEKLAESYYYNGQTEDAEFWYAKFVKDTDNPEHYLHYAQVLQSNDKCEDAVRWYEEYKKMTDDQSRTFIEDCEELKNFPKRDAKITNLESVNTEYLDYSPIEYADGMVFTSTRGVPKATKWKDSWTQSNFADVFYMKKTGDYEYTNAAPISNRINKKYHDGVVTFNNAGTMMIFSRNNLSGKNSQGIIGLKLYYAKNPKKFWADIGEAPIQIDLKKPIKAEDDYWINEGEIKSLNSDDFSSCHPSWSQDEKRLYFASNRPGGYGGMDIWVSLNVDGEWKEPQNLGPIVNSSGNELFPFIGDDEKLYYASDGHRGLGGLDIFVGQKTVETDENTWNLRENIGTPFNTPKDDFGFFITKEREKGFLSSNREGGKGGDDIYAWEMTDDGPLELEEDVFNRRICVFDEATGDRIEGATVSIKSLSASGKLDDLTLTLKPLENSQDEYVLGVKGNNEANGGDFVTDKRGLFKFRVQPGLQYQIVVDKKGYMLQRNTISTSEIMEGREYCIPIAKKECMILEGTVVSKGYQKPVSGATVKLLDKCRGGYMEATSDADGHFEFCIECNCDYQLLAEKQYFTAGSTTVSTMPDSLDNCNEREKIQTTVEITPGDLTAINEGNEINGQNLYPNGYPYPPANQMTPEQLQRYFLGDPNQRFQVGQRFTLRNIYYDYDKYNIRYDAANDLDYLITLMNTHPSMEIVMESHTDSRGSQSYNQWLAKKRANAAMRYLTDSGVEGHRIQSSRGYGETRLVNGCSDGMDCSEEEHQRNRRTEILIVRFDGNEFQGEVGK